MYKQKNNQLIQLKDSHFHPQADDNCWIVVKCSQGIWKNELIYHKICFNPPDDNILYTISPFVYCNEGVYIMFITKCWSFIGRPVDMASRSLSPLTTWMVRRASPSPLFRAQTWQAGQTPPPSPRRTKTEKTQTMWCSYPTGV